MDEKRTSNLPALGALAERLGIELLSCTGEEAVATMPVAGNTQPFGWLNGGASAALAETVASVAAQFQAAQVDCQAAGKKLEIQHLRPAKSGLVRAVATLVGSGERALTYEIEIFCAESDSAGPARLEGENLAGSQVGGARLEGAETAQPDSLGTRLLPERQIAAALLECVLLPRA